MAAEGTGIDEIGAMLQELVNRVSHRGGEVLALMNDAGVTLQQVLLLTRLREAGESNVSELAERLGMSLPAISQMVERLYQLGLLSRVEDREDRRRKLIATTAKARGFLDRLVKARAAEYGAGIARLPPPLRLELARLLRKILTEPALRD